MLHPELNPKTLGMDLQSGATFRHRDTYIGSDAEKRKQACLHPAPCIISFEMEEKSGWVALAWTCPRERIAQVRSRVFAGPLQSIVGMML